MKIAAGQLFIKEKPVLPSQLIEKIKELAMSGQLQFGGKKLILDLFTPYEFCLEAKKEEGQYRVQALIRKGEKRFLLSECEALLRGPQPLFIKEGFLHSFANHPDWELLSAHYPLQLSPAEWENFCDDEEIPILGDFEKVELEIWPILRLQDGHGAFAELICDYRELGEIPFWDQGKIANHSRNKEAERLWEKDLLETAYERKGNLYSCPLDQVASALTFLIELGWKVFDSRGKRVFVQSALELSLIQEEKKIHLRGEITFEEKSVAIEKIGSERFVDIDEMSVGLLDGAKLPAPVRAGKKEIAKEAFGELKEIASYAEIDEELSPLFSPYEEKLPSQDFVGTLYPYQQEGLNFLSFLKRNHLHGILADEMGLGKTVQVLAFFSLLESQSPLLIVAPTSLIFNWRKEIERFLPGRALHVHNGSQRQKNLPEEGIIVTSYAILRQDFALFAEKEFAAIILDEAQMIKNPKSQTSQLVCQLHGHFRLSVTGTPVENRIDDLYAQFRFLMPSLLDESSSIKERIAPFILRRRKGEVDIQLPEKIEQEIWIEMGEEQRALYERYLYGSQELEKNLEILEAILRLRQILCHPLLVEPELGMSAKLERLLADLEEVVAEGHKVIVYSQFTEMLTLISKALAENSYLRLDGSTKNREAIVEAFQNDPEKQIFLISLKAGGVGLNLTAADYVFLYDPWWNEAVENQAIDRAHRLGRETKVIARRYLVANSIEEKIMELKTKKSALAQDLLDTEQVTPNLTQEELLSILKS